MAETSLTFYRGAAVDADRFYAVGYFDDLEAPGEPFPRMRLVQFDRATEAWDILTTQDWSAAAIHAWRTADGQAQIAVASTDGIVLQGTPNDLRDQIVDSAETLRLNAVWGDETGLAVAGAASAAYVASGTKAWRSISDGVSFQTMAERIQMVGQVSDYPTVQDYMAAMTIAMEGYETFNAVGGNDADSLLLAGNGGRLAYWDGRELQVIANDISVNLAQMVTTPDGWIVAGSAPSTYVAHVDGQTLAITPLAKDDIKRTLTGVTVYKNKVIVCGLAPLSAGMFEIGPTGLAPFGGISRNVWALVGTKDGLWALGEKELRYTDDTGTQTFASPFL